jgi:Wzt-like putative exopolysaccharide export protein
VRAALAGPDGEPTETVPRGEPLALDVVVQAARPLERPVFVFQVRNEEGQIVFDVVRRLDAHADPGRRIALAGAVDNPLVPGRYALDLYVREDRAEGGMTVQGLRLLHFDVAGRADSHGIVTVAADLEPALEDAP